MMVTLHLNTMVKKWYIGYALVDIPQLHHTSKKVSEMTEVVFTHYQLTWKFTDDGQDQVADFWLPGAPSHYDEEAIRKYMKDVLNLVELSASEYGYEYELKVIESRTYRMVG